MNIEVVPLKSRSYTVCSRCNAQGLEKTECWIPRGGLRIQRRCQGREKEYLHLECWLEEAGPVIADPIPGWEDAQRERNVLCVEARALIEKGIAVSEGGSAISASASGGAVPSAGGDPDAEMLN